MSKQILATEKAPGAIGPYSQGIYTGELIFTSGQLPIDVADGILITDIKKATAQCIENIKAILEAGGSDLSKVVKVTVFLSNMDDFADMNEAYAAYFSELSPARSAIQVARLPKDAVIEIEAIAMK